MSSRAASATTPPTAGCVPRIEPVILLFAAALAAQDHVGKPVPEYLTGDECLFCHEIRIGRTWQSNPHAWTIRPEGVAPVVNDLPAGATHVLGSGERARPLKLTGYGQFAMGA